MKARVSGGVCCAAVFACAVAAFGQAAGQQPTQPQTPSGARPSTDQEMTITGCVQREADYRQARDAGRGGAAGTGVGVGNEFVLTNASSTSMAGAKTGAEPTSPTGTTGAATSGQAYELTGPNEGQLAQHVGRRVEIRGKLKASETGPAGQPTGGATAGQPPGGVDATSKDLKLREFEVTSVKEATGTCPAGK